jgi:TRAP transporter 4TM/12TM fusion protein
MTDSLRTRVIFWAGLVFAVFQIVVPVFVPLYEMQLRALHVMLAAITLIAAAPLVEPRARAVALGLDLLLVAVAIVANLVIFVKWEEIITYPGGASALELVLGVGLVLVVLDGARRAAGWAIPVCVILMLLYVFAGPYMPGIWAHPGFPLSYVIESLYYSASGIYGSLTGTSATFIAMFILFGALLQATGGGQTFMELALWCAGRFKGGPAKVGVVASSMFGMISGSAVANVSVTGNYTIPLMRRLGYERNFAGGVEAMSSTGGGITPPIMGIAAFIMADFLGISYLSIIGYAVIPCLLFYAGIIAGVHFEAQRLKLAPVPESDIPAARTVFAWRKIVPLFVPIGVLLGLLFIGYTLLSAGFYACMTVIALYLLSDLSAAGLKQRLREVVKALADGGVAVAQIAPLLVAVAIFTSLLGLTGVAAKVSSVVLDMGGENLVGALLVAALIPLVLGAPLPVAATYILSAALIAPALVKLKLDVVAVHMFLLYWATLASVTPPTCTACVIGAKIAGGHWFRTSLVGMRLGAVAFVVPFFFVLNPALIGRAAALDVLICAASGLIGAVLLAAGFFGYMRSPLSLPARGLYLAAGGLLLAPSTRLLVGGALVAAAAIAVESLSMLKKRREEVPG